MRALHGGVIVLGAGGHGQVVADIILRMKDQGEKVSLVGFLDDNRALLGNLYLGAQVLGACAEHLLFPDCPLVVALGDNRVRADAFFNLKAMHRHFYIAWHPAAVIAPDATIGDGTMICAGVIVNTGAKIGRNVILNTACTVDHHCRVGDHVHVAPGVHMGGEVFLGEGCLVGIGATVLPRTKIGAWSVVAAGAIVCEDVPDNSTVAGVPARIIGTS